jgi:hypothetical protein
VTPLSLTRQCSAKKALARGLADYLRRVRVSVEDRVFQFRYVLDEWPTVDQVSDFPAAVVLANEQTSYSLDEMTSRSFTRVGGSLHLLQDVGQVSSPLIVSAILRDGPERELACMAIEAAMSPVDWMCGCRMVLPYYHNAVATYQLRTCSYEDNTDDANRGFRRLNMEISGETTLYRYRGEVPTGIVQFTVEVEVE